MNAEAIEALLRQAVNPESGNVATYFGAPKLLADRCPGPSRRFPRPVQELLYKFASSGSPANSSIPNERNAELTGPKL